MGVTAAVENAARLVGTGNVQHRANPSKMTVADGATALPPRDESETGSLLLLSPCSAGTSVATPAAPAAAAAATAPGPPPALRQLCSFRISDAKDGCSLTLNDDVVRELCRGAKAHTPSHTVFFTGDTGVGKTHVLQQLLERRSVGVAPWMLVPPASALPASAASAASLSSCSSAAAAASGCGDVVSIPRTAGVTVHKRTMVTPSQKYAVLYLDSEGYNASAPPVAAAGEEEDAEDATSEMEHHGFRRPAVLQLLPHLACRLSDVIVYVWDGSGGDEGAGRGAPAGSRLQRAYVDCVRTLRLAAGGGGGEGGGADVNKPSLLLILNKMPLRHCYDTAHTAEAAAAAASAPAGGKQQRQQQQQPQSSTPFRAGQGMHHGHSYVFPNARSNVPSAGPSACYIPEEVYSRHLRTIDERNGGVLRSHFGDVRCYALPLRGSKWKGGLTGSAVFDSAMGSCSALVHSMLTDVVRSRLRGAQGGAQGTNVSELAWALSLAPTVASLNDMVHKWGQPSPLTAAQWTALNREGFARVSAPPTPPPPLLPSPVIPASSSGAPPAAASLAQGESVRREDAPLEGEGLPAADTEEVLQTAATRVAAA